MIKKLTVCALVCALGIVTAFGGNTVYAAAQEDTEQGVAIDETNFPGPLFRQHVLNGYFNMWYDDGTMESIYYDANQDGYLSEAEVEKATYIGIEGTYIENVKGIEYFTDLVELGAQRSSIKTIDLSKNVNLQYLNIYHAQLVGTLDLSANTKLDGLACQNNPNLTGLNVTNCVDLYNLNCSNTGISELDVSKNLALQSLTISTSNITDIDLSNNVNLKSLECYGIDLEELDVSNNTQLEYLDCSGTKLTGLDVSNNTNLYALNVKNTPLAWLNLGNNSHLEVNMSDCTASATVIKGTFDIEKVFPGMDADKITMISGAVLTGSEVSGYDFDTPVVYSYDCGMAGSESITLNVTLNLTEKIEEYPLKDADISSDDESPKTDDAMDASVWMIGMAFLLTGLVGIATFRKRGNL